jgi:hypothetical protein
VESPGDARRDKLFFTVVRPWSMVGEAATKVGVRAGMGYVGNTDCRCRCGVPPAGDLNE